MVSVIEATRTATTFNEDKDDGGNTTIKWYTDWEKGQQLGQR